MVFLLFLPQFYHSPNMISKYFKSPTMLSTMKNHQIWRKNSGKKIPLFNYAHSFHHYPRSFLDQGTRKNTYFMVYPNTSLCISYYIPCPKCLSCSCRQKDKVGTKEEKDCPNPHGKQDLASSNRSISKGQEKQGHAN